MPFKSKAQMRAFFAKEKEGELPKGTAKKWANETPNISKLPEHVKKACLGNFIKISKNLFDPLKIKPVPMRIIQQDMITAAKQDKMKGMSPVEYRNDITARRAGIVQRNRQSAKNSV